MTNTPPTNHQQGFNFPDGWDETPMYPSKTFGGTREGEVWTPRQAGQLFLGSAIVSDGVTLLRGLVEADPDAERVERALAISEATEWTQAAVAYVKECVTGKVQDTDLGELLLQTSTNLMFLCDSIREHVHRIGQTQD